MHNAITLVNPGTPASLLTQWDAVELLNQLLRYALQHQISDIHLEPKATTLQIRVRLDGILQPYQSLPLSAWQKLSTRIKVLANLDLAEHRLPQDGRFQYTIQEQCLDLRVSSCPTHYGEKFVLRLLPSEQNLAPYDLGLTTQEAAYLDHILRCPSGLILVTGPTGSGKTTTLAQLLERLPSETLNICSIEDPIEIQNPRITQIAVHDALGLSFSVLLKTLLRQDPDVVVLGEIRDAATAHTAHAAAHSGRLVLASIHTQRAQTIHTRLESLGLTWQQSASDLVLNQRLFRTLCHCKKQRNATLTEQRLGLITVYEPQGCNACHQGYKGRFALTELYSLALPLGQDLTKKALLQVAAGTTSLMEVHRSLGLTFDNA